MRKLDFPFGAGALRNALESIIVSGVELTKVQSDAFYNGVTCWMFASMLDHTVGAPGKIVCGSKTRKRPFSQYWTFIRRRGVPENQQSHVNCPNCGAILKINMSGACEFCGGKIASGNFDRVLSRIEQDEAYTG